jgi:hypothetical protein
MQQKNFKKNIMSRMPHSEPIPTNYPQEGNILNVIKFRRKFDFQVLNCVVNYW